MYIYCSGRRAKDGEYICCKLNKHIADMLNQYSDKTAISKTTLIEQAVELYISRQVGDLLGYFTFQVIQLKLRVCQPQGKNLRIQIHLI